MHKGALAGMGLGIAHQCRLKLSGPGGVLSAVETGDAGWPASPPVLPPRPGGELALQRSALELRESLHSPPPAHSLKLWVRKAAKGLATPGGPCLPAACYHPEVMRTDDL